jgi:hypothetical protein
MIGEYLPYKPYGGTDCNAKGEGKRQSKERSDGGRQRVSGLCRLAFDQQVEEEQVEKIARQCDLTCESH